MSGLTEVFSWTPPCTKYRSRKGLVIEMMSVIMRIIKNKKRSKLIEKIYDKIVSGK